MVNMVFMWPMRKIWPILIPVENMREKWLMGAGLAVSSLELISLNFHLQVVLALSLQTAHFHDFGPLRYGQMVRR